MCLNAQTRFPLYDAHGNSVATLGRAGTNSWTLGDERSYDAWGRVRLGGQTGAPSARYCASLGHVQDDESGLVYMRARYYEPGTGRFVSEDPAMDGYNWFVYADNDPVNKVDASGKSAIALVGALLAIVGGLIIFWQPTDAKGKALKSAGEMAIAAVGLDLAALAILLAPAAGCLLFAVAMGCIILAGVLAACAIYQLYIAILIEQGDEPCYEGHPPPSYDAGKPWPTPVCG